jgi:membrane-associated phospholipid phosphatase
VTGARDRTTVTAAAFVALLLVGITIALGFVGDAVVVSDPLFTPSSSGIQIDEAFFGSMTALGDGPGLIALVSALAIFLVAIGRSSDAVFVAVSAAGAAVITRAVKVFYHAPRPPTLEGASGVAIEVPGEIVVIAVIAIVAIALVRGWGSRAIVAGAIVLGLLLLERATNRLVPTDLGFDSFPSGHALSSASFATAVILIAWPHRRLRWAVLIVGIGYALAVGVSRMYVGVHYPADVAAGWCLGVAWTLVWWIVWRAARRRWPSALGERPAAASGA